MVDRFKKFIAEQHLVPLRDKVLLAVSGGRDSVCMAHLFSSAGIPFAIAHCNFNLRPGDCDRDEAFVRQLAEGYGVPFHVAHFDTRAYAAANGMSIEEAARHLRYDYFASLADPNSTTSTFVATAHHSDDSVETFFLNLFRGTGIAGLHGIRPLSVRGPVTIVRPMLCFSRRDIDGYIRQHRLAYVEDITNSQLDARRNQIRHRLMPLLRELYPSVDATMLSNMEHLYEVEKICDTVVDDVLLRLRRSDSSPLGIRYDRFGIDDLLALDPNRPLLYAILHRYGFSSAVVDTIIAAMQRRNTGARFLSPVSTAVVDRDSLLVANHLTPSEAPRVAVQPVDSSQLSPSNPLLADRSVAYVDADLVHQPFTVRRWHDGDRFYPFGMTHQRLVSDFLKDCKINILEKHCVYFLVDADQRIVWIIGLRADNRFRVTDATRNILKLKIEN